MCPRESELLEDANHRIERAIRVTTAEGSVEGNLRISPKLRTLDDLNLVARRFVNLHDATSVTTNWKLGRGMLAVNKASILFVREVAPPPPRPSGQFGSYSRASVKLCLKGYEIEGFVHVPAGGVVMKRLDQGNHPFISLTDVLIVGEDEQRTAPFVAVNRNFITAAQEIEPEETTAVASSACAEGDD